MKTEREFQLEKDLAELHETLHTLEEAIEMCQIDPGEGDSYLICSTFGEEGFSEIDQAIKNVYRRKNSN